MKREKIFEVVLTMMIFRAVIWYGMVWYGMVCWVSPEVGSKGRERERKNKGKSRRDAMLDC